MKIRDSFFGYVIGILITFILWMLFFPLFTAFSAVTVVLGFLTFSLRSVMEELFKMRSKFMSDWGEKTE